MVSSASVTAETDHFSDWVAAAAPEAACFAKSACAADASVGGPVGIDCRVPAVGSGVHCAGNKSPYTCTCDGQTAVIATLTELPSSSLLSALAVQCGATCVSTSGVDAGGACTVQTRCEGDGSPGYSSWRCSTTNATNALSCSWASTNAATTTCSCVGAAPFTLPGSASASSIDVVQVWKDHCAGQCIPGQVDDGGSGAADGGSAVTCPTPGIDASPTACEAISNPCSDGDSYGFQCPGGPICQCLVDGAPTKDVDSTCNAAWDACGFPKRI